MKKLKFLAVALAAITMFSCSKESEVENGGSNTPGEKSTLTIKVTGKGNLQPQSRVAGSAGTDVTVNNYIVFLFRNGGGLDCPAYYSASNADATITEGTTAAKTAYVVANTGALEEGAFENVSTETELKAVVGDLMSTANTASQTKTNLWMSGTGAIEYGEGSDATKGSVTVAMGFVSAKIELIVKDNRTNMTGVDNNITIEDKEVVLLFAGKTGKFFDTAANQSIQSNFYSGDRSYPDPSPATESTALSDAVTAPFDTNAGGTVFNHFYTFGNDGATMPTILAIKSTKIIGGVPGTVYYPIHFTTADAGYTIVPGNHYTVTLTLNGDVNAGGGGGTTDPEEPFVNASIEVKVTAAEWNAIIVDKEFN